MAAKQGGPEAFVRQLIRDGNLTVTLPGGARLELGDGTGKPIAVKLVDRMTLARIVAQPYMGIAEAYMDGRLIMEQG